MQLINSIISEDLQISNHLSEIVFDIDSVKPIDAFFIPTQCKRKNIDKLILEIQKYSKNIFCIVSDNKYEDFEIYNSVNILKLQLEEHYNFTKKLRCSFNPTFISSAGRTTPSPWLCLPTSQLASATQVFD
jgi:hypothetical protein